MLASQTTRNVDENIKCKFLSLCVEISQMAKSIGVEVLPFVERSLPRFSSLTPEAQKLAFRNLSTYHGICSSTIQAGNSVQESKSLIWFAIKAFGFRPTSDLFNFVTDDHVIEIHDQTGVQIFRNFQFYKFCSYSIEELYCVSWPDLFSHEGEFTQQILEKGMLLLSGNVNSTIPFNVTDHKIQETNSICKFQIRANVEFGSPLFNFETGRPEATIVLEKGDLLNPENRKLLQEMMPYHHHISLS
jgi:hypothetical protein